MPRGPREVRYDIQKIGEEIERARIRLGVSVTDAARLVPCQRTSWYKKVQANGSRFHLDEIDRLAVEWNAPRGWPFIPWEEGETIDVLLGRRRAPEKPEKP